MATMTDEAARKIAQANVDKFKAAGRDALIILSDKGGLKDTEGIYVTISEGSDSCDWCNAMLSAMSDALGDEFVPALKEAIKTHKKKGKK